MVLEEGQSWAITTRDVPGDANDPPARRTPGLPGDVSAGDPILIDDGRMRLRVTAARGRGRGHQGRGGGKVSNHKGINLPGVDVSVPALSEKDSRTCASPWS